MSVFVLVSWMETSGGSVLHVPPSDVSTFWCYKLFLSIFVFFLSFCLFLAPSVKPAQACWGFVAQQTNGFDVQRHHTVPSCHFCSSLLFIQMKDDESDSVSCTPQPDLLNFKKGWMSKLDDSGEVTSPFSLVLNMYDSLCFKHKLVLSALMVLWHEAYHVSFLCE